MPVAPRSTPSDPADDPSTLRSTRNTRVEICPPSQFTNQPSGWLQRLGTFFRGDAHNAPTGRALAPVRQEFLEALADVDMRRYGALLNRIESANTLQELWHLRSEVFNAVALCHSQYEADQRLTELNRHFPVKEPRNSSLGSLT